MKAKAGLAVVLLLIVGGLVFFSLSRPKQNVSVNTMSISPTPASTETPTPFPDTKSAIEAYLANKYQKPVSEVHVTVNKEVPGFASGSVMFGNGGPGEGGMWLALLGSQWQVVWDGNGSVDCNKMRHEYGFPDTILKPNFCD